MDVSEKAEGSERAQVGSSVNARCYLITAISITPTLKTRDRDEPAGETLEI